MSTRPSNKFVKNIEKEAAEHGFILVKKEEVSNIGYFQSDGIKPVAGGELKTKLIDRYIFQRK